MILKHTLTAAALATVLASPAFAQQKPDTMTKPDAAQSQPMKSDAMEKSQTQPTAKPDAAQTVQEQGVKLTTATDKETFVQAQHATDWRGSKVIGATVYGPDNASIGDVNDVLVDNNGQIRAVVIGVGGFLGVGEKDVAIPFDTLHITRRPESSSIDKITVSYTKDELKRRRQDQKPQSDEEQITSTGVSECERRPASPPGAFFYKSGGAAGHDKGGCGAYMRAMRTLMYLALFGILALAAWFAASTFVHFSGESIPVYGYVAIAGGVVMSLLVGGGLMALVFYSSRHGYDDLGGDGDGTPR
jgi:sporulation protein YlmC with PRC-barrel domain